jgi:hypothetical protein
MKQFNLPAWRTAAFPLYAAPASRNLLFGYWRAHPPAAHRLQHPFFFVAGLRPARSTACHEDSISCRHSPRHIFHPTSLSRNCAHGQQETALSSATPAPTSPSLPVRPNPVSQTGTQLEREGSACRRDAVAIRRLVVPIAATGADRHPAQGLGGQRVEVRQPPLELLPVRNPLAAGADHPGARPSQHASISAQPPGAAEMALGIQTPRAAQIPRPATEWPRVHAESGWTDRQTSRHRGLLYNLPDGAI